MLTLLRTSWQHHHLLANFILRDLRVKYRGTILGYFWSLLEPLSLVLIYWFLFVVIARRGDDNYPLTVMLGVLCMQFFTGVTNGGAGALTGNAGLIRRVRIPREIFVVAIVGSTTVVLLLSLIAVIPFMLAAQVGLSLRLGWAVVGLIGLGLFSTGLGLMLACANAIYRDVGYVLRVTTRLIFYVSPVIYPIDMVPERIRDLYLLNPLAVFITQMRCGVMNEPMTVGSLHLAWAALISVAMFAVGARVFSKWQAEAVKFL